MKLRCQANSIRLRLKRSEVDRLVQTGCVEERITFGSGPTLAYRLETSRVDSETKAIYGEGGLVVRVPAHVASAWASNDQPGIEVNQPIGEGLFLQVLVEKDFACLNGSDEQNDDTFANPLAGTKC